jgi:hypothetical protein
MTDDLPVTDDSDEALSRAYRALAVEQTRPELDRAVVAAARRRPDAAGAKRGATPWYRPVTVAATIGLSLALILELSETTMVDSPAPGSTPTLPANVFEAEGSRTAAEIERLGTGMQPPVPAPVAPDNPASAVAPAESLLPADESCSESERSTPGNWWACIERLEQGGLTLAAERELQALLRAHPGISPPP